MDREEQNEIAYHRAHGLPETTRGPYYHKVFWEGYKGAVKGLLGGIMVGGMLGAMAGGVVVGTLSLATIATGGLSTPVIGGIMATTTLYGMHKFADKFEPVGAMTGSISAGLQIAEERDEIRERVREATMINEVRELKGAIAGKIPLEAMHVNAVRKDTSPIFDESDFKATHQTDDDPSDDHKLVYWNVAAIGAAVGAAVAAIAGFAAVEMGVLHEILGPVAAKSASIVTNTHIAIVTAGAALGASYGVSRDLFRKIFDVTDCWFMGVASGNCDNQDIAQAKGQDYQPLPQSKQADHQAGKQAFLGAISDQALLNTTPPQNPDAPTPLVRDTVIIEPQQSRYFRDKLDAQTAKKALLSMDHENAQMH